MSSSGSDAAHGRFKQPLVAVSKSPGGFGMVIGQAYKTQFFHAARHGGPLFTALPGQMQHARHHARLHAAVPPGKHIFQNGKFAEKPYALKGASNAKFHNTMGLESGNRLAVKEDTALFRRIVAVMQVTTVVLPAKSGPIWAINGAREPGC